MRLLDRPVKVSSSRLGHIMKMLTLGVGLMAGSAFGANPPASDRILSDLSRCDRTFFATLGQHAGEYASNPHFRTSGIDGYFQVADRSDPKLAIRKFEPPLKLGNFEAVAYFDEVFDMDGQGAFVAWGFILRAPIKDVVAATRSLLWESQRLRQDDAAYVRSELWTHAKKDAGWEKVATVGGQVPKPGTVERVLLIEPFEEDASLTRFGCSLQGAVTREMLKVERPDVGR